MLTPPVEPDSPAPDLEDVVRLLNLIGNAGADLSAALADIWASTDDFESLWARITSERSYWRAALAGNATITGVSELALACVLLHHGLEPQSDLLQLFARHLLGDNVGHRIVASVCASLLQAINAHRRAIADILAPGIAAHDRGDFDAALECYEQALTRFPNSAWAWHERALTLVSRNSLSDEQFRDLYGRTLRLFPFYEPALGARSEADRAVYATAIRPFTGQSRFDVQLVGSYADGARRMGEHWWAAQAYTFLHYAVGGDHTLYLTDCLAALGIVQAADIGTLANERRRLVHGAVQVVVDRREELHRLTTEGDLIAATDFARSTLGIVRGDPNGGDPTALAAALIDLADTLSKGGDSKHAAELARQVLDLDAAFADDKATACVLLAFEARRLHDLHSSAEAYHEARVLLEAAGETASRKARVLISLAAVRLESRDLLGSRSALIEAELLVRSEGDNVGQLPVVLLNLAEVEANLHNVEEAWRYYRASVEAADRGQPIPDEADSQAARRTMVRADIHRAQGDLSKAVDDLKECLKIERQNYGEWDPRIGDTQNNLGLALTQVGQYGEAQRQLESALAIRKRAYGESHPLVATTLNNLAVTVGLRGDAESARHLLQECLDIRRHALPPTHDYLITTLQNLGRVAAHLGYRNESAGLLYEAAQATFASVAASFGALEYERFERSRMHADGHGLLTSLALDGENMQLARMAFEALVNSKALATGLTARRSAAASAAVPHGRYRPSDVLSSRLCALAVRGPQGRPLEQYYSELRAVIDELRAKSIADDAAGAETRLEWARADGICQLIPAGSVFVDISLFRSHSLPPPLDTKHDVPDSRYLATVLTRDGIMQFADLGLAEDLNVLARRFHNEMAMYMALPDIPAVQASAARTMRQVCRDLFDSTLGRLQLGDAAQLVLCLDGYLALVPFACLVLPNGEIAIERYEISYLAAVHDLLIDPAAAKEPSVAKVIALFGNPDFGAGAASSGHDEARTMDTAPNLDGSADRLTGRAPLSEAMATDWGLLEGTATEINGIVDQLNAYRTTMRLLTWGEASKTNLANLHRPYILHLATHAYYLAENRVLVIDDGSTNPTVAVQASHAMCCGIVLAGANVRRHLPGTSSDDGIVTGLELSRLDLMGTRLVVLSGCETAVGTAMAGDSMHGLRRACHTAGALNVVSCLWQIPDATSALIAAALYRYLASEHSPATALRLAMLEGLTAAREAVDAYHPHPYSWASWAISGDLRAAQQPLDLASG